MTDIVTPTETAVKVRQAHQHCEKLMSALLAKAVPGVTESALKEAYVALLAECGGERTWHAPQIRFGCNTLLPFGRKATAENTLQESDIFFIDIGPVFEGVEADYAVTVATDPSKNDIVLAAKDIWHQLESVWQETKCTGVDLYKMAYELAMNAGFQLDLSEGGHKIGPFPHNREAPADLKLCDTPIAEGEWILEVKLIDPARRIGAFFEGPLFVKEVG